MNNKLHAFPFKISPLSLIPKFSNFLFFKISALRINWKTLTQPNFFIMHHISFDIYVAVFKRETSTVEV